MPPCNKACKKSNPARAIRAIRFGNAELASQWITDCTDEELEKAEQACIHYDRPIRFRELFQALPKAENETNDAKPSLAIDFCGIHCENPFFLASSAVCTNYDMVARA